ncbi:MAG: hypothetical protein KDD62_09610, partial [Bdellovibrionales bacterium]|nr:hypothetical protein [Bdellovibrionales bacterium]
FVPGVDESKSFSRDILKSQEFRSLLEDPSSRGSDIVALAKRHPVINYALNAKPRTAYIMDTEPHTVCVIDQFNKYFPDFSSSHLSRAGMVLMLLLHDIGKDMQTPLMSQHATTLNVIEEISKDLPLSDQELRVVRGVIDGDVLGSYAQKFLRKPASEPRRALAHLIEAGDLTGAHYRAYLEMFEVMSVTEEQRAMFKQDALLDFAAQASEAGLSAQELYPIVMPYYCCDLSGYSLDAGAYPALEGFWQFAQEIDSDRVITFANRPSIMLVRKENRPRLLFTPVVEQAMVDFEAALGV